MGIGAARLLVSMAGVLMVAPSGCGFDAETRDTLEPLDPPPGQTIPETPATAPTETSSTSTSTTPTEEDQLPTGDWERGERFDVGRIESLTGVGGYRAIRFDRYTYQHPRRGHLDAPSLRSEPIVHWYPSPPFVNSSPQLRTFVLDPDVTILVLDPESRPDRCGRGRRGEPSWRTVGIGHLETRRARQQIASLTYSDEGLVTRIRFTRGC